MQFLAARFSTEDLLVDLDVELIQTMNASGITWAWSFQVVQMVKIRNYNKMQRARKIRQAHKMKQESRYLLKNRTWTRATAWATSMITLMSSWKCLEHCTSFPSFLFSWITSTSCVCCSRQEPRREKNLYVGQDTKTPTVLLQCLGDSVTSTLCLIFFSFSFYTFSIATPKIPPNYTVHTAWSLFTKGHGSAPWCSHTHETHSWGLLQSPALRSYSREVAQGRLANCAGGTRVYAPLGFAPWCSKLVI